MLKRYNNDVKLKAEHCILSKKYKDLRFKVVLIQGITLFEPRREKTVCFFCICENKDADQLRGNREADQRLFSRYIDRTIPLLPKSEISSL